MENKDAGCSERLNELVKKYMDNKAQMQTLEALFNRIEDENDQVVEDIINQLREERPEIISMINDGYQLDFVFDLLDDVYESAKEAVNGATFIKRFEEEYK